jgi:ribonuclease P protein component
MYALKGKKNIGELFIKGKRWGSYPLIAMEIKNSVNLTRCGVSVPKKRVHLAVRRNRLKRQIREAIRVHQLKMHQLENNYDMMWTYIGSASSCEFDAIQRSVHVIIKKIRENEKKENNRNSNRS